MNITVYLGANEGNDPKFRSAVEALGKWIGESGNDLVYGGSKSGLMGVLAESVLKAGGKVTGVEPRFHCFPGRNGNARRDRGSYVEGFSRTSRRPLYSL